MRLTGLPAKARPVGFGFGDGVGGDRGGERRGRPEQRRSAAGRGGEAIAHRGPETRRHAVAAGNYWRAPLGVAGGRGRAGNSRGLGARGAARTRACQVGGVGSRVTAEVVAVGRLAPKEEEEREGRRSRVGAWERRSQTQRREAEREDNHFASARRARGSRRGVGDRAAGRGPRAGRRAIIVVSVGWWRPLPGKEDGTARRGAADGACRRRPRPDMDMGVSMRLIIGAAGAARQLRPSTGFRISASFFTFLSPLAASSSEFVWSICSSEEMVSPDHRDT